MQALTDLFPNKADSLYRPLMRRLGYDPDLRSRDITKPEGVAQVACGAVLEYRHHDHANQAGEMTQGAYADWTRYEPVNRPLLVSGHTVAIANANRWQPLTYVDQAGNFETQEFFVAQWCYVTPFALLEGDECRDVIRRFGPATVDSTEYRKQAEELVQLSATLGDFEKAVAEYWEDASYTEQPPGHWIRFAEYISERDHHTLDDDVKMFFVLSNALLDSGIAAWDAKRTFDSVRPISAIRYLFHGQSIRAWGGPGKGTVNMDGGEWLPYQAATRPTPAFPEFVSGHSTFSAAAAEILQLWTGSDRFEKSVLVAAGSSRIEPRLTPANPVTLRWKTFSEAADQAGMSRRYGGIHFKAADLAGRTLGRFVANKDWEKAQLYFQGNSPIDVDRLAVLDVPPKTMDSASQSEH